MSSDVFLNQLKPGEEAVLIKISDTISTARRLAELGFLPGTKITCILSKKGGETSAFDLRGTMIALRKEDSSQIAIHLLEGDNCRHDH